MDIGKEKKKITVEPVKDPVPRREPTPQREPGQPEPQPKPVRQGRSAC